jgi:hypothetical protein
MLSWLVRGQLDKFEREWGYDASYLREILAVGGLAAARFMDAASKMIRFRRGIQAAPHYAAALVSTLAEDCGPCTQLGISMAEREGIDPTLLRAVVERNDAALPADVRLAVEFTRATLAHDVAAEALREQVVKRWGREGALSLAYAIAAARIFPTVKYALGYGHTCTRLRIGDADVAPHTLAPVA